MPTRSQKKKKEPTPWELSKPIFTKDILEGTVNATMDYKAVQKLKTEYQAVPEARFKDNLKNLRKWIQLAKTRAARDAAAMRCNRVTLPGINRTPVNLAVNKNNQPPNVGVVVRHPSTIPAMLLLLLLLVGTDQKRSNY
jgi:hypothetical protein